MAGLLSYRGVEGLVTSQKFIELEINHNFIGFDSGISIGIGANTSEVSESVKHIIQVRTNSAICTVVYSKLVI